MAEHEPRRAEPAAQEDEDVRALLERVRVGELTQEQLRLASFLGHVPAQLALGKDHPRNKLAADLARDESLDQYDCPCGHWLVDPDPGYYEECLQISEMTGLPMSVIVDAEVYDNHVCRPGDPNPEQIADYWAASVDHYGGWEAAEQAAVLLVELLLPVWQEYRRTNEVKQVLELMRDAALGVRSPALVLESVCFGEVPDLRDPPRQNDPSDEVWDAVLGLTGVWVNNPDCHLMHSVTRMMSLFSEQAGGYKAALRDIIVPHLTQGLLAWALT